MAQRTSQTVSFMVQELRGLVVYSSEGSAKYSLSIEDADEFCLQVTYDYQHILVRFVISFFLISICRWRVNLNDSYTDRLSMNRLDRIPSQAGLSEGVAGQQHVLCLLQHSCPLLTPSLAAEGKTVKSSLRIPRSHHSTLQERLPTIINAPNPLSHSGTLLPSGRVTPTSPPTHLCTPFTTGWNGRHSQPALDSGTPVPPSAARLLAGRLLRNQWNNIRSERKNKKKKPSAKQPIFDEGQLFSIGEPLRDVTQEDVEKKHKSSGESTKNCTVELKNQPRESQLPRIDQHQLAPPIHTPSEDVVQSQLTTPQLNNIPGQRKHESLFKHNLEEGLLRRIAQRKVRRHVFGEINAQKVNQFGTACSAFHALATTEMQNFTLPSDLPMTSRMLSKGIVCTTESDLKSLQLTFPELDGEESAEHPTPGDKKNSPEQTKMPPLPPLIKPSRSRLSQIKTVKSCHLPSVPTVVASSSLKWGKY
ncbi:uncharacterized protein LOC132581052 [Heteronotia binoei]|uniref:uncharacterized protein LOC132581052 n=1 Tax=Heteronotia binoei TaxID=13085 RepID=UPI00292F8D00|nr:uncharacterized protein LOC132581052 [Heteronotia binoei]